MRHEWTTHVPLDRHHAQINRKLTRRETRLIVAIISILAAAIAAIVLAVLTSSSTAQAGCVDVITPGSMGANIQHACGQKAVAFCQSVETSKDSYSQNVRTQCRKAGYH